MMNKTGNIYHQWLATAAEVIVRAGKEIMTIYGTNDFKVELKADESPLTIADKKAHNIIVTSLAKTGLPVLSEESDTISWEERRKWHQFWLVDPLDGTKEFIKHNDQFTVNIALIENNQPVMGLILLPVTGNLFFATKGEGSYRIEIHGSSLFDPQQLFSGAVRLPDQPAYNQNRIIASKSHLNEETKEWIRKFEKQEGKAEILSFGSSLKLCVLAEGGAEIYPRLGPTMEWDIAAGHVIVTESGGKMMKMDGHPVTYNKEDLHSPWFIAHSQAFKGDPVINEE